MTTKTSNERLDQLITQLREMRLPVMADQLRMIYLDEEAAQLQTLDLLEMIVTEEFQNRKQNTIRRHLKQARLSDPTAHLNELDYAPDRQLNAQVIEQLATNQYIHSFRNVIIQGATGTGKSFVANALANHAISSGYTALYQRMTELLASLQLAEIENNMMKVLKKFIKVDVLIIDDFLLTSTSELEQKHLLELFELRNRSKPLILCSQMNTAEWHKKLGGGAVADAILDRAISKSYHVFISGESKRLD